MGERSQDGEKASVCWLRAPAGRAGGDKPEPDAGVRLICSAAKSSPGRAAGRPRRLPAHARTHARSPSRRADESRVSASGTLLWDEKDEKKKKKPKTNE